jgi:hypothetical protein
VALTAAEWRRAGFRIARRNGLSEGGEMFAWILDGTANNGSTDGNGSTGSTDGNGSTGSTGGNGSTGGTGNAGGTVGREDAAATLAALPPPLRLLYRTVWKPRFDRTPRW